MSAVLGSSSRSFRDANFAICWHLVANSDDLIKSVADEDDAEETARCRDELIKRILDTLRQAKPSPAKKAKLLS